MVVLRVVVGGGPLEVRVHFRVFFLLHGCVDGGGRYSRRGVERDARLLRLIAFCFGQRSERVGIVLYADACTRAARSVASDAPLLRIRSCLRLGCGGLHFRLSCHVFVVDYFEVVELQLEPILADVDALIVKDCVAELISDLFATEVLVDSRLD